MKVLQVSKLYPPVIGGVENHLHLLANELKNKIETKVLIANTKLKTEIEREKNLEIVKVASLGRLFSLPLAFSFPLWFKGMNCDILHFHLPFPLAVISYLLMRPKGRVVVTYHSDIIRQRLFRIFYRPFLMRFLKRADCIIAASPNLRDNSPVLKRFKDKCEVIPFGIDLEEFRLTPETAKKSQEIKEKYERPLILFVGRLVSYKGLKYLIEAMKEVEARLLIIGKGPLEARLKRLAGRWGIEDRVIWMGEVDREDLISFYHACDLLILPSISNNEAFGIVQLEAFACGKPVISTDLPTGVPFVNLHEKTGLIVPPGNSKALSRAINGLLESPNLREKYGQYAKERVEKEFTKELMTQRVLKLYQELI